MKSSTSKIVAILLVVIWLSYIPQLYPLPWNSFSEISMSSDTRIPWLSDDENAVVDQYRESMPVMIWAEWALSFFIISAGILVALMLLWRWKASLFLCPIPSVMLLIAWYIRHANNPFPEVLGVPERTLLETLSVMWSDVIFLVRHTGNYFHYFDFLYYHVAFPIVHVCFVVLFLYWIYDAWAIGNEFRG